MVTIPTFYCEPIKVRGRISEQLWQFKCPYCQRLHIHGAWQGHHASTCISSDGEVAFPRGYVLKLDPRYEGRP